MPPRLFSEDHIRKYDIDQLKQHVRWKLGGYSVAIHNIRSDNVLYRAVRWDRPPTCRAEVSYPPAERATPGRLNRAGQSMFYASPAAPCVFYEVGAQKGRCYALSEWELTETLWMHNLGYHPHALAVLGTANSRPLLSSPIEGESKHNARLRAQLSRALTEIAREGHEHFYKLSIAINELMFDGASPLPTHAGGPVCSRAAGTVYPAMAMRGAADNVALLPEFTDRSLRLKSVRYVLVEDAHAAASSYTWLTLLISEEIALDGTIRWHDLRARPEEERRSYITLENGYWVLRNGYGRVYDLHAA